MPLKRSDISGINKSQVFNCFARLNVYDGIQRYYVRGLVISFDIPVD